MKVTKMTVVGDIGVSCGGGCGCGCCSWYK